MEFLDFKLTKDSTFRTMLLTDSNLCPETSNKNALQEFHLRTAPPTAGIGEEESRKDGRSGEASQVASSEGDYFSSELDP